MDSVIGVWNLYKKIKIIMCLSTVLPINVFMKTLFKV